MKNNKKNVVLSTASKFNINIIIAVIVIIIGIVVELHFHAISMFVYVCVFVLSSDPAPNSHRQHFPAFTISLIGCIFFRSLLHFHISLLTILFLFPCPSLSHSLYLPPLFLPLCNCLLYSPYQYGSEVRRVNLTSVWHVNACCPSSTFTPVCVCVCVCALQSRQSAIGFVSAFLSLA